jgi:ribosomal protein L14
LSQILDLTHTLGDRIIVVVQKQRSFGAESPGSSSLGITNKVRRGDIRHAVVVRAKKEIQRKDGGLIRFDDNACVLINKTGDPIGTRLTSMPVSQSFLLRKLTSLQAWLELSCEKSGGLKYYP